jgi:hypothetical protein
VASSSFFSNSSSVESAKDCTERRRERNKEQSTIIARDMYIVIEINLEQNVAEMAKSHSSGLKKVNDKRERAAWMREAASARSG